MDQDNTLLKYKDVSCIDTYIDLIDTADDTAQLTLNLVVMISKLCLEVDILVDRQNDLVKDVNKVLELVKCFHKTAY